MIDLVSAMATGGIVNDEIETIEINGETYNRIWVDQSCITNFICDDLNKDESKWNEYTVAFMNEKYTLAKEINKDEDWNRTYHTVELALNKEMARKILENVNPYTGLSTDTLTTTLVSIAEYKQRYNYKSTMDNNGEHCPAYDVLDDDGNVLFLLELW